MKTALRLAAIALPLAGLGAIWAMTEYESRQGTEWDVPIRGYDPRDLLRGHYVEYVYDWPGLDATRERDRPAWQVDPIERLCIAGFAPVIRTARRLGTGESAKGCDQVAAANRYAVYGVEDLVRGRLYVSQDRARRIEAQMRDRNLRGIVRLRIREDGSVTPVDIRFRPLTAAEIADRDRPADPEATVE